MRNSSSGQGDSYSPEEIASAAAGMVRSELEEAIRLSTGADGEPGAPGQAGWQPWPGVRLVDVVATGTLVIVILAFREARPELYFYCEDIASYLDDMVPELAPAGVTGFIVVHISEQMGGVGWQNFAEQAQVDHITVMRRAPKG